MQTVLFLCVHNAGRSQMAEAFLNDQAAKRNLPIRAVSAGTLPGNVVNPLAETVMREVGISLAAHAPKLLTQQMADAADRLVTMGCGVEADACPARVHVSDDWGLDDPAGQPLEKVREIRDQIQAKVQALLSELTTEEAAV